MNRSDPQEAVIPGVFTSPITLFVTPLGGDAYSIATGYLSRATASKIPVILAVLDGNLVCSYNVYCWHIFNNHPNYGCKSLEYSQNFRSITVSGLPYLMKNPHFDAVALVI